MRSALDAGLDGLETDLQRTGDGVLVLSHDPYLGSGGASADAFIAKRSLAELRTRHPDLLTLGDLRGLMEAYPSAVVNLELKTDAPWSDGRAGELAAELARWPRQLTGRVWVSTFDPLQLLELHAAGVGVPLAFLAHEAHALALLPALPVAAVHPHHTLVTEARMRAWRERGLAVFTWTVNDAALAERLLGLGVDGLIGDDPALLLAARA